MLHKQQSMKDHHFLLATLSAQGHINPTLELAKRLIHAGARVTVATTIQGQQKIKTFPTLDGLNYVFFSETDGISDLKLGVSKTFPDLLTRLSNEGRPVTFLIYNIVLPWAAEVARGKQIPSALLFAQSAAVFAIYHAYLNTDTGVYNSETNYVPPREFEIQGLPKFELKDQPSILQPDNKFSFIIPVFREHFQTLEQDPNPCVLVNTFDALEENAIKAIANKTNINLFTVGPLLPSANYLDKASSSDEVSEDCENYIHWLNSKPDCSVVYVSFGSLAVLTRNQSEEIFHGLVGSGRPFFWVIRPSTKDGEEGFENVIKNKIKEEEGLIVPWCSQVEVLTHRAIGCFLTHCGWNSTLESLTAGVPMIAFPQFSDQMTNAKLVEDVWGIGIRVKVNNNEGEDYVEKEEIRRCVEMVMESEKGEDMRKNAKKWRGLALEAMKEGGSSQNSLKGFPEKFGNHQ